MAEQEYIQEDIVDWGYYAACKGKDPDIFYPTVYSGSREYERQVKFAKNICRSCVVQSDCLEYALETKEQQGVWGGIDERGRRRILEQRIAISRANLGHTATKYN